MKQKIAILILLTTVLITFTHGQRLWNFKNLNFFVDRDRNNLKMLMLKRDMVPFPRYELATQAAKALSYLYGESEKDYIITNMQRWVDSIRVIDRDWFWMYYFQLQYIKGFLGDQSAIIGMDSVIQYNDNRHLIDKMLAIELMAEAGQYNYFDIVRNAYTQNPFRAVVSIGLYGRDSRFRDESRSLIEQYIRSHPEKAMLGAGVDELCQFDRPYAVQLLDQLFHTTTGETRYQYFMALRRVDKEGQPERVMWVIPIEPDSNIRYEIMPWFDGDGTPGTNNSIRYLQPHFIKFAKDRMSVETANKILDDLYWIVSRFIPVPLPSNTSVLASLDTLISFKTQVASYGWVGDNAFVTELSNYLTNARSAFIAGDSTTCARQIFAFQSKVDEEYRDSLDGDTRTITLEGWKFLHYHSQYILERLSTITTLSLPINANWNMVSSPLILSNPRKDSVYPEAISSAFAYLNGYGYVEKDTLKNGVGYWLKYPYSKNIDYTGLKIDTVYVAVEAGWNMIGSVSQPIPITKIVHDENAVPLNYFGFDGAYFEPDSLLPGKGYWVKVSGSGTLIIGKDASAQGSQNVIEPPPAPDAPSKPVLQSPADGATGQSTSPILSWYAVENANTYRLQAATDSNFYFVVIDQESITDLSYQIGPLSYNTKYYWHVKAYNVNGYSYWSNKRSFTTQSPPSAPPTPTLASPANGATNISTSPTLIWYSSSGATSYRLQVSRYSSFSTLVFDNAAITATSKQVSALSYSTIYYWRVNASNSNGTSAWSSVRSFTTQSAPSSDPCLPATSTASLDEFTISDANGNRQNLFVHNGGRGLHLGHPDYDLPPETPKGAFHARFKSGKFVEIIPPNKSVVKIPIKIKDVVLPITLQWKVRSGNKVQYWLIDQKKNQKRIPLTGLGKYSIDSAADNLIYIEAQASEPCITN